MTIEDIAYKINLFSKNNNNKFSKIQELRNKHGFSPRTWNPFAAFSIKDDYAFHAGGRKEFQFNFGHDYVNKTDVFRYGIAFSLNEDRTLHNSKAEFKPAIDRFNNFLTSNEEFFEGFNMWYYSHGDFVEFFNEVKYIDEALFQAENFIFIGKYFIKEIEEIVDNDIQIILETFDYLMPLYELVQFGVNGVQKRIARICWNSYGWIMPSGRHGKSLNEETHEAKYGYGHEEWLLDTGKLINGYHYGFLEPIRKQQNAYTDYIFNVWLYTIDGETKKRYWIGEIKDLQVLNKVEAENTKAEYVKRGWFKEMEEQIRASGANTDGFSDWKGVDLFNVKYVPSNLKINDPYFEVPLSHPLNGQSRYSFAHFKNEFDIKLFDEGKKFVFQFLDKQEEVKDGDNTSPEIKTHIREPKSIEITYLHKAISKALTKELRKIYGNDNVQDEHWAGYGANKIDIVVKDKDSLIFYEIKSYTSLRTSIREAIGQLMEYSLWIDQKKAKQLIVVTQPLDDFEHAKIYFKHLRDTFNLPIYYQSFDFENNILSELV